MSPAAFPTTPGIYVLWLRLAEPSCVQIGRLGTFALEAGLYAYVGSAYGPGGLRGRLAHHLRPPSAPRWHIDYLRTVAPVFAIWWAALPHEAEHTVAARLADLPGACLPIPRFGASDCRCPAHLVQVVDWLIG